MVAALEVQPKFQGLRSSALRRPIALREGNARILVEPDGSVAAFDLLENGKKLKAIAGSPYQVTCPGFCTSNPTTC